MYNLCLQDAVLAALTPPADDLAAKIELSLKHKEEGNTFFKNGDTPNAFYHYHQVPISACDAIDVYLQSVLNVTGITSGTDEQKKQIEMIKITVHNNLGMLYLKREKWDKAAKACSEVLHIDKKNVKALYRRGKARFQMGLLDKAVSDLKKAQGLDPTDKLIKNELILIERKKQEEAKNEQSFYAGMFKRMEATTVDDNENRPTDRKFRALQLRRRTLRKNKDNKRFDSSCFGQYCADAALAVCSASFGHSMWKLAYFFAVLLRFYFCFSNGYIHPDEYFQSGQIVAPLFFNCPPNLITPWEFSTNHTLNPTGPARTILGPAISYGLPYTVLTWCDLILQKCGWASVVTPRSLLFVPRLFLFLLSFIFDQCITKVFHEKDRGASTPIYVPPLLFHSFSWITLVFLTRTFSNTLEALFVTVALTFIIVAQRRIREGHSISPTVLLFFGFICALGSFIRVTFVFFVLPAMITALPSLFTHGFIRGSKRGVYLGNFTLTPFNFFLYNQDPQNLALHGIHFRGLHLLVNMPMLYGPLPLFFLIHHLLNSRKASDGSDRTLLSSVVFSLICISSAPHQEPRFLIPTLFSLAVLTGQKIFAYRVYTLVFVLFNLSLVAFFGVVPSIMEIDRINASQAVYWRTYMPPTFLLCSTQHSQTHPIVEDWMGLEEEEVIERLNSLDASHLVQNESIIKIGQLWCFWRLSDTVLSDFSVILMVIIADAEDDVDHVLCKLQKNKVIEYSMPLQKPEPLRNHSKWWRDSKSDYVLHLQSHKLGRSNFWELPFRIVLRPSHYILAQAETYAEACDDWQKIQDLVYNERKEFLLSKGNGRITSSDLSKLSGAYLLLLVQQEITPRPGILTRFGRTFSRDTYRRANTIHVDSAAEAIKHNDLPPHHTESDTEAMHFMTGERGVPIDRQVLRDASRPNSIQREQTLHSIVSQCRLIKQESKMEIHAQEASTPSEREPSSAPDMLWPLRQLQAKSMTPSARISREWHGEQLDEEDLQEIIACHAEKEDISTPLTNIWSNYRSKFLQLTEDYLKEVDEAVNEQVKRHSGNLVDHATAERMKKKERKKVEQWRERVFYGDQSEIPSILVMEKQLNRTMDMAKFRKDIVRIQAVFRGHQVRKKQGLMVTRALRRMKILKEMVHTEEFYCRCLHIYRVRMMENPEVISASDTSVLFSNVDSILRVNETLLSALQKNMQDWSNRQKLSTIFSSIVPMFKLYTAYINNYETSMKTLNQHNKFAEFRSLLQKCRSEHPDVHLDLQSLLIMPIQRTPRYELLLREYLKNMEEEHEERQGIERALNALEQVGSLINESKRKAEGMAKIIDIQERIIGHKMNLVEPHRILVREGGAYREHPNGSTIDFATYLYLFNDGLLITQKKKSWLGDDKNNSLLFKEMIPINRILTVSSIEESIEWKRYGLVISCRGKEEKFWIETQETRDQWVDDILFQAAIYIDRQNTLRQTSEGQEERKRNSVVEVEREAREHGVKGAVKKTMDMVWGGRQYDVEGSHHVAHNLKEALHYMRDIIQLEQDIMRFPIEIRTLIPNYYRDLPKDFINEQQSRTIKLIRKLDEIDMTRLKIDQVIKQEYICDVINRLVKGGTKAVGEVKDMTENKEMSEAERKRRLGGLLQCLGCGHG
ncbi:hypothetical protein PROFUN_05190 [Planoprotostelium fungivorum]|uniref:DH domain-containing protein n=1 Tax=Planoprotostelium fungivorum TaxID=1890364 RepID=A0A2P6NRF3_9EUKA|nr:hypothetical protein PROFUN_05190 [Planoprotostelium fungivorum]